ALWFKGCDREDPEPIVVTVPEQSGSFDPQLPIYLPGIPKAVYITKWKDREIETDNPVNDSLAIAYQQLDSLQRYVLFLENIQIRRFSNDFEDEYVKITTE